MLRCTVVLALCVLAAGCGPVVRSVPLSQVAQASATTQGTDDGQGKAPKPQAGMIYFLPKAMFRIKVEPKGNTDSNGKGGILPGATNTAPTAFIQNNTTITANSSVTQPSESKEKAAGGHDIEFTLTDDTKFTLDVFMTIDPSAVYSLWYVPSALADDDFSVTVKDNFISSVATTTQDRSADVAKQGLEFIKQAILLGTGLPTTPTGPTLLGVTGGPPLPSLAQDIEVDPFDYYPKADKDICSDIETKLKGLALGSQDKETVHNAAIIAAEADKKVQQARENLRKVRANAKLPVGDANKQTAEDVKKSEAALAWARKEAAIAHKAANKLESETNIVQGNVTSNISVCLKKLEMPVYAGHGNATEAADGIYYRTVLPYTLTILAWEKQQLVKKIQRIVLLPNKSPTYMFDLTRSAFVKKTYDVKFESGFLTSAKINKPSELLAGVSLPVDLIKGIASIPAEIIQLKFNYNSNQQALLEAEKAKFDSLKAFNDAILQMYQTNATQAKTVLEQVQNAK